jgi:hypothetical protein
MIHRDRRVCPRLHWPGLQEQLRIDLLPVRHGSMSMEALLRLRLLPLTRGIGELPKHKTVANIPGNARELPAPYTARVTARAN